MDLSLNNLLGLGAGLCVVAVGLFVLAARPNSFLHRFFFLLALADAASTLLFGLSYTVETPELAVYFRGVYWYFFLLFVALLGAFAVLFPRPFTRPHLTALALGLIAFASVALCVLYARRHDLFWSASLVNGRVAFAMEPWGNVSQILFAGATAFLGARMTLLVLREPSDSHRRQAAFVLGGMTLAYAPYAATITAQALLVDPRLYFLESRWDRVAAYWAFAAFCVSLVASGALLLRHARSDGAGERRFVLGCYGGVLALALAAAAFPSAEVAALLRSGALLAYPVLLGYAIA